MAIAPVRVTPEIRDDLLFIKRELSPKYNRDLSMSDVIQMLITGYDGNPRLAEYLREIIPRRPSIRNPFGLPEPGKEQ